MEKLKKPPHRPENRLSEIVVLDEPGQGGAFHEYEVRKSPAQPMHMGEEITYAKVSFQNGPVKEHGVNGCHQEDLLEIVEHRLESFQAGEFACDENAQALHHINMAIQYLNSRTSDRKTRGVEGTNKL